MINYQKVKEIILETKSIVFDKALREKVREKAAADFVTAVDIRISEFVREKLNKLYPHLDFMSEEEEFGTLSQNRWILDPIDGTTNLVFDYQLSSVSLALLLENEIVFAIVYNPFTNEFFSATKGKGAFLNGNKLFVSDRNISQSLIEFGAGSSRKNEADISFKIAKDIFMDAIDLRRICSSALAISYIAAKRVDGYFERELKPWDYAAASLILQEAGGMITDWQGNRLQFDRPSSIVASNQKNHEYLLNKVNQYLK